MNTIPKQQTTTIGLLAIFAITIVLQRVHSYSEPLDRDITGYAVIAHEMRAGRHLYTDLWERKPPLLYATFAAAESITGYGRGEIFLLNVSTALLTLILIYVAGGLLAALFWTILCGDLYMQANQPNAEVFINVCLTAALVLLLRWPTGRRRIFASLLLGALFSAATLYKHHAIIICVAMAMGHILRNPKRKELWTDSLIAGGVVIFAWGGVVTYFAAVGRLNAFIDVLFHQNLSYAGNIGQNLAKAFEPRNLVPGFMIWAIGPLTIFVVWLMMVAARGAWGESQWRKWTLLLITALGAWMTIALPGWFFPHYYQFAIPLACIAAGWAGAGLLGQPLRTPGAIRYGVIAIVLFVLIGRTAAQYQLSPEQWAKEKYSDDNYVEQDHLGRDLATILTPGESFWTLGEDNPLYFISRHSPPTGLLYLDPLIFGDEKPRYWRQLMDDLERAQPGLVVVSRVWVQLIPPDAPVLPWLAQNYAPLETPTGRPTYQLLARRQSQLQRRLVPSFNLQ